MRYGYFDDVRREYVISQPDTPLPWINYLGTEAHFGTISNTAGGLRIDPVLPSAWPGFTATRRFRGATYEITVRRAGTPGSGTGAEAGVRVDGNQVAGTLLPLAAPGETVRVEVVLPAA